MKKPSVKQAKYGAMAAMALGALIIFIGLRLDAGAARAAGAVVIAVGFILDIAFVRCPHCGRYLGRAWGDHCQFCGKPFDGE